MRPHPCCSVSREDTSSCVSVRRDLLITSPGLELLRRLPGRNNLVSVPILRPDNRARPRSALGLSETVKGLKMPVCEQLFGSAVRIGASLSKEAIMARIEPLGIHEVDDEIRHLCEETERQSGTSASTRTYAKNPGVLKALTAFRTALAREGTIDPVIRELVRLKIAGLNACRY